MKKPSKKPTKPKFDPDAKHVLLGYARVSMADQNPDLQIDALKAAGCERIFYDQASGSGAKRPELDNLLREVRHNDVVVVWKLDRLGRSIRQILNIFWELDQKGAKFKVLTESWLDTANPVMAAFTLQIMAAFSELEKALIGERTRAGLAAAKLRGRVGGRASYATDEQVLAVKRLGPTAAAKRLGYKTTAAYIRRLAEAEKRAAAAAQPQQEATDEQADS